ncbi:MAG: CRISPR-associated protein Cas4 [Nanoarchaeota archaeon]
MISASDLSSWSFCPRQVYFQKVLGIKPEKTEAMIKGTIKHKIFEEIIKSYKKTGKFNLSRITKRVLFEYDEDFKNFGTNVDFFKDELECSFGILSNKIKGNEFSIPHFCEKWVESEDLGMKARIDAIFGDSNDWIVGDLKTSTSDFLGTRMQIGAGALLFEKQMNINVQKIRIISHKDWTEKEIELTDELREYILETRDEIKEMLETKELPTMSENPNKCAKCDFWDTHCNPENDMAYAEKTANQEIAELMDDLKSEGRDKPKSLWRRIFG